MPYVFDLSWRTCTKRNTAKTAKKKKHKKKWCIYGNSWNSALGCFSCSIIRLTVLRSFVWLHDSPSARLADRILMIHELRGSNLAHTKSSTSSAPLLCVYLSLVSCFVLSFTTLLWYPLTHKHWDIFLYSTLAFWYPPKKTGLSLVQHQSLGGTWEESECLTAFYTREQVLQDWNTEKKACICAILEFSQKKGSLLVLLLSFCFHVLVGVFLIEQCLERETDTNISYSGFCTTGGPFERGAIITP